ncbi:MAG: peptide-methionine (S)-S-oxide reductase MsrA [Oscillospiraceae bacterium]|nr:peptide-methionine (S)-S-oxide reductase MsrA [Oscillospiraceae bacterium]
MTTLYLAAGCFWGAQHFLQQLPGVEATRVGYANGRTENPSYEQVKHEGTGHAETVEVVYDETVLSTPELLECYFMTIDPTSVNKQGEDEGEQYRTGIYYTDPVMLPVIQAELSKLEAKLGQKTAIECKPLEQFFPAEEYHQDYLVKNPNGYCHIPRDLIQKVKQKLQGAHT